MLPLPPLRGSGRGRQRGPAGRTRPGQPGRRRQSADGGGSAQGRARTSMTLCTPSIWLSRASSAAGGGTAGVGDGRPRESSGWPARSSASTPAAARPPMGPRSFALCVVMAATATVVMNSARTRPLTARNPARGSSASRRAAISESGRLVRRARTCAPTIVSQGPAVTRPTMISRKPGRNAWICPGNGRRAAVHDEEAELGQTGQQREHPPDLRRLGSHPTGDAERGSMHPAQRQPSHHRRGHRHADRDRENVRQCERHVAGEEGLTCERDRRERDPQHKEQAEACGHTGGSGHRGLHGRDYRHLPGPRPDQPHRCEPLLPSGRRQPGRGGDEDQHRNQQGQRHHRQDQVDAAGLGALIRRAQMQPPMVSLAFEAARQRGCDRGHLDGVRGAGQLRGGAPDDDDQRIRGRQRGVADHAREAAGVAVGEFVYRGAAQQPGQRRGRVVLARQGVTGDAWRHR